MYTSFLTLVPIPMARVQDLKFLYEESRKPSLITLYHFLGDRLRLMCVGVVETHYAGLNFQANLFATRAWNTRIAASINKDI